MKGKCQTMKREAGKVIRFTRENEEIWDESLRNAQEDKQKLNAEKTRRRVVMLKYW